LGTNVIQSKSLGTTEQKAILVVDDDELCRMAVARLLTNSGLRVVEARHGEEAWEQLATPKYRGTFSLIISDISMPILSGLHLAARVRCVLPDLPILFLTAHGEKEYLKRAMRLGVNDYFEKQSLDPVELIRSVTRLLNQGHDVRARRQRDSQTVESVRSVYDSLWQQRESAPFSVEHQAHSDAGGDYFRFVKCHDGRYAFAVVDVAGHSVESSYALAAFLGLLSSMSSWWENPLDSLHTLNKGILGGPFPDIPICVLLGCWEPATGALRLANAGIPNGIRRSTCHDATVLAGLGGTPIGIFAEGDFGYSSMLLDENDRVLLTTDGIYAPPAQGATLDEHKLGTWWAELNEAPLENAVAELRSRASSYFDNSIRDDVLLIGFEQGARSLRPNQVLLQVDRSPEGLESAIHSLDEQMALHPIRMTAAKRFDFALILREVLQNALDHAIPEIPDEPIKVLTEFDSDSTQFSVRIFDGGRSEIGGQPIDTDNDLRLHGRGLLLVQGLAKSATLLAGEMHLVFDTHSGGPQ
jgi:CheY-like chemotaxis protein